MIISIKKYFVAIAWLICLIATPVCMKAQDTDAESVNQQFKLHYMGNVECGNVFPWENFMNSSSGFASLTTTHGVVIKPWLYTGLGAGFEFFYCHDGIGIGCPLFADVRFTYPNKKWRPFVNIRAGVYSNTMLDAGNLSLYFQLRPSVGIKYAFKDTFGCYLSFGAMNSFIVSSSIGSGLSINLGFDF